MSSKKNPDVDWGFHIRTPRIVRTGYKHLTHAQKWLYVCLKDLCGDTGTCYRSLRALSEETDMSTGLLSESIPVLHNAGLIHATMKKRSTGGKAVWHISIVDIWQANAQAHPTKRSQNEPTHEEECSECEQTITDTDINVQNVNENVQNVNKNTEERSFSERECSFYETEVITRSNNITKAITEKQKRGAPAAAAPQKNNNQSLVSEKKAPTSEKKQAIHENSTPSPSVAKDPLAQASPVALAAIMEWIAYQGAMPVTEDLVSEAEKLAKYQPEPGEVQACADWMYANDKKHWYDANGMTLGHVARDFGRFRSIKKRAQKAVSSTSDQSSWPPSGVSGRIQVSNPRVMERLQKAMATAQAGGA